MMMTMMNSPSPSQQYFNTFFVMKTLSLIRGALAAAAMLPLVSCETEVVVDEPPQTMTIRTEQKETIYRRYPDGIVQTQVTTVTE